MRWLPVLLIALAQCATAPATPTARVDAFYRAYPERLTGGLPSGRELKWLRPQVSERLYAQFVETLKYEDDWIRRHPDTPSPDGGPPAILKPPFADGVHFDGSPDGHTSFVVAPAVEQSDGTWRVPIQFRYEDAAWESVAIVKLERGRYVIDDIVLHERAKNDAPVRLSEILRWREPE